MITMATRESRVGRSGAVLEMTDAAEFADNLGAVLVVVAVVQIAAALVGWVAGGVGAAAGFVLTVPLATLGVAGLGWVYVREPRRTERALRRVGRGLAMVYALWGVTLLGAWTFGIYLTGVPGVLTPPVHTPPLAVAAFYAVPAALALGLTHRVRAMDR